MKQVSFPLILLSFLLLFQACDLANPDEQIPAYIQIDSVGFVPGIGTEGGRTVHINDVWVYVDGILQGVYELPALFPVIATGEHEITFKAGIKNNGISASRIVYPFYSTVTVQATLTELQTSVFYPVFSYKPETTFPWIENFEDAGLTLDTNQNSQVPLNQLQEGSNSYGSFSLSGKKQKAECISLSEFQLPKNEAVFLEMEYRNTMNFTVGMYIRNPGTTLSQGVITLYPREEWTKIYIDLSYYATVNSSAEGFTFFLGGLKTDTLSTQTIQFDNLKLVHF